MSKTLHTKAYKELLGRLKNARLEMGLKQTDVANELKKPQSYVSKIESGERRIDVIELSELAKMYKKDITYFVE